MESQPYGYVDQVPRVFQIVDDEPEYDVVVMEGDIGDARGSALPVTPPGRSLVIVSGRSAKVSTTASVSQPSIAPWLMLTSTFMMNFVWARWWRCLSHLLFQVESS